MLPLAVSNGDVIIIVVLICVPVTAIAFAGAGAVYREIGKGVFSMDHDTRAGDANLGSRVGRAEQQAEIRQMLEAKSYRQQKRGKAPLDIEEEMRRINSATVDLKADPALVEEVRQLVVARNARRRRQGKEPLDVQEEIARQLRDLEGLGE